MPNKQVEQWTALECTNIYLECDVGVAMPEAFSCTTCAGKFRGSVLEAGCRIVFLAAVTRS